MDSTPVCLVRVIGGKQQEYFRLERVGILELVHEEMAEAPLQLAANSGIVPDQIARLDEKIEEVEPSRLDLQGLVDCNRRQQGVMEKWSEIGVARLNEGVEISFGLVPEREDFIARSVSKGRSWGALPCPTLPASDSTKIRFESVIVAITDRLQAGCFADESRSFGQIPCEIVVRPRAPGRERSKRGQFGHSVVDRAISIERLAPPGRLKVTVLAKRLHCTSQLFAWRLPARSTSKDATDALGWIGENSLKPILKSRIGDLVSFLLRGDFEERIDSRLDRPFV